MQKFAEALAGQHATKGIFITASSFTNKAVGYSSALAIKVVLLDGLGLANLMIEHGLVMVRRCVPKRIVETTAIPFRGVDKSIEIFLDIDRIEEQAFVPNLLCVFDQNSFGAIDAPHLKSRPKESAVRVKLFQPRHRMETIDRHSILAIKAVIGPITDSSSVEQALPFHAKIKRLFPDLVGPPHTHSIFVIQRQLQRLTQREVSSYGDRTFIPGREKAAAEAVENAQMRISIEIVRHPADVKCFKIPALEFPSLKSRCRAEFLTLG